MSTMQTLTAQLTKVAGCPVEITIRGERQFTISTDTPSQPVAQRIANFFRSHAIVEIAIDDELGTFVYVDA